VVSLPPADFRAPVFVRRTGSSQELLRVLRKSPLRVLSCGIVFQPSLLKSAERRVGPKKAVASSRHVRITAMLLAMFSCSVKVSIRSYRLGRWTVNELEAAQIDHQDLCG
jgi:hypothetical protein